MNEDYSESKDKALDIAELAIAQLLSLGYDFVAPPEGMRHVEAVRWMYTGKWKGEPEGVPLEFTELRVGKTVTRASDVRAIESEEWHSPHGIDDY